MRITLRLPDELHRRLEARSRAAGASLNQTIVSALHDSLSRRDSDADTGASDLQAQVQQVRLALGDLVAELDESELPEGLRAVELLPDADALRGSLPRLDPPLSATVIADREDRV